MPSKPKRTTAFVHCKRVRNASAASPCLLGVDRQNRIQVTHVNAVRCDAHAPNGARASRGKLAEREVSAVRRVQALCSVVAMAKKGEC